MGKQLPTDQKLLRTIYDKYYDTFDNYVRGDNLSNHPKPANGYQLKTGQR